MPLYEYLCGSCGLRFERIRKFSDPPLTECPSCGGAVEKQLSSPAIQFKGSGFYITDYPKAGAEGKTVPGKSTPPTASTEAATTSTATGGDQAAKADKPAAPAAAPPPAKTGSN